MSTIKNFLAVIIRFFTGLGFYGLGLLVIALMFWFLFSGQFWTNLGTGFFGAFIYKNYAQIVKYLGDLYAKTF